MDGKVEMVMIDQIIGSEGRRKCRECRRCSCCGGVWGDGNWGFLRSRITQSCPARVHNRKMPSRDKAHWGVGTLSGPLS